MSACVAIVWISEKVTLASGSMLSSATSAVVRIETMRRERTSTAAQLIGAAVEGLLALTSEAVDALGDLPSGIRSADAVPVQDLDKRQLEKRRSREASPRAVKQR